MAGTLIVDEIRSGTTAPPAIKRSDGAVVGEVCRARAYIDMTTTPASVASGFNVSSVTDNGTGDMTVNFAAVMPNAAYSLTGAARHNGGTYYPTILEVVGDTRTAAAHRVKSTWVPSSALADTLLSLAYFGG